MAGARLRELLIIAVLGPAVGRRQNVAHDHSADLLLAPVDPGEKPGPLLDAKDVVSSSALSASAALVSSKAREQRARARVQDLEAQLAAAKSELALAEAAVSNNTAPKLLQCCPDDYPWYWDYQARQIDGTGWCWLASVVVGLHHSGELQKIFQKHITVKTEDEETFYWSTSAGKSGKFKLPGNDNYDRPLWQLVLESIFMLYHHKKPEDRRNFQTLTQTRFGEGQEGRAEAIRGMFALIRPDIQVSAQLQSIRKGLKKERLAGFLSSFGSHGAVYVMDKKTTQGGHSSGHAIAVDSVEASGNGWNLDVYNQGKSEEYARGTYWVEAGENAQCTSTSSSNIKKPVCDGLWLIQGITA